LSTDQGLEIIDRVLMDVLAEANKGKWPKTIWDFRRVAKRFGIKIVVNHQITEPIMRYKRSIGRGVLYLPRTRNMGLLHVWLRHEMAEIAMEWAGEPEIVYCPEWGTHHDFARRIERLDNRSQITFPNN
jgi:hypothetical protein